MNEKAIYFFAPTAGNIAKFESIQNEITGFMYFTNQSVKIGNTEINTNFIDPITGLPILAIIQKAYFCTSFDLSSYHDFMMTFDDVHYFDNQKAAENFKNGINL
jgi:hypothetical protein